jgi:DNA mismatch endonuclease (patch repair protein)
MAPALTKSEQMSRVRSSNTLPERLLRETLTALGVRYRLNYAKLPGHPDVFIPRLHTAIFVHGCFWHGHDCAKATLPKTNAEFWATKINHNRLRDARVLVELRRRGIRVVEIWTCEYAKLQLRCKRIAKRYHAAGGF